MRYFAAKLTLFLPFMKKLLLPLAIIALAGCTRDARTEIKDNNPRSCWACTHSVKTAVPELDMEYTTSKDTVICDKTGIEIAEVMSKKDTGRVTIQNYTLYNIKSIEGCRIR